MTPLWLKIQAALGVSHWSEAMDLLQDRGLISDECVSWEDVPETDLRRAWLILDASRES